MRKNLPATLFLLLLFGGWELGARQGFVDPFLLPAPSRIAGALAGDWAAFAQSGWVTVKLALASLGLAVLSGVAGAAAFALAPRLERALLPLVIALQVTPVVAVAPLLIVWFDDAWTASLLCAWLVALFPLLSNTLTGLRAADPRLLELFALYRATPLQRLRWLLLPSSLPYFLAGLRVGAGLALIGAVVAEFAAGAAGAHTGLASRLLEAMFRNDLPRMFAALALIVATGLLLYAVVGTLERWLVGRWKGR
ncbi:MAG: ABC transporter permease subunit [Burkholderiales bacterium]|nr:ABC transporter permease subunit [Burkholderiales bacterium]